MINKAKQNFDSIKAVMRNNLETIKSLFDQTKTLNEIMESMQNAQIDEKERVESIIRKQLESIDKLLTQTDELFTIYYNFLEEISK